MVVSFNTCDKLRHCLKCIESEHEVIVVDNGSADGSADMVEREFPYAVLIRNPDNLGFGGANNLGFERASRPLVLYLNSDAYAEPGAIGRLAALFEDEKVAGAGGKLLNPDRTLQASTANRLTLGAVLAEQWYLEGLLKRVGLPGYWNTETLIARSPEQPIESDQLMGACLMVRRDTPERFDERYFLYVEDTDLCLRLRGHGKLLYDPSAVFVHDLGSSSSRDPWMGIARYNLGKELYFQIHSGKVASSLCWLINRSGALLRLVYWSLRGNRRQVGSFYKVLTARRRQLDPR